MPAQVSANPTATTPAAPAASATTSRKPCVGPPTSAGIAKTGPRIVPEARWKVAPADRARQAERRPEGKAPAPRLMATPRKTPAAVVCWMWMAWCLLRGRVWDFVPGGREGERVGGRRVGGENVGLRCKRKGRISG